MMATRAMVRGRAWGPAQYLMIGAGTVLLTLTLTALSFGVRSPPVHHHVSPALIIHLATVIPALPLGAYLLVGRKGDRLHRLLGRIWAVLMIVTAISSFWLQSTGSLSFIHLFAVMTLVSVPLGVVWIRRGNVEGHRRAMTGVYIGLVVAGGFAFTPGRLLSGWLLG